MTSSLILVMWQNLELQIRLIIQERQKKSHVCLIFTAPSSPVSASTVSGCLEHFPRNKTSSLARLSSSGSGLRADHWMSSRNVQINSQICAPVSHLQPRAATHRIFRGISNDLCVRFCSHVWVWIILLTVVNIQFSPAAAEMETTVTQQNKEADFKFFTKEFSLQTHSIAAPAAQHWARTTQKPQILTEFSHLFRSQISRTWLCQGTMSRVDVSVQVWPLESFQWTNKDVT